MKPETIFRTLLLLFLGVLIFTIANSYKSVFALLSKANIAVSFLEQMNISPGSTGSGVVGKWKISLGDGQELYYLLLEDHEIKQIDKKTYDSTRLARVRKSTKQELELKQIMEGLRNYLKTMQDLSSLSEKDFTSP